MLLLTTAIGAAAADRTTTGTLRGLVTALGGETALPDALVVVEALAEGDQPTAVVATLRSNEQGRFETALPVRGRYRLSVSLPGFVTAERIVEANATPYVDVAIDLVLEGTSETIEVVPDIDVEIGVSLGSAGALDFAQLDTTLAAGASVEQVLPLLPGVIRGPDGVSIKGGRPTQSALLVGGADYADPATGDADFRLPSGAVGTLEVLPSPYAVELGRFSAGVTVIHPRKGGEAWRLSLAGINPSFRTRRDSPLTIIGVESFSPRATAGGPLIAGRLFLMESGQFRYRSDDVESRPQDQRTLTVSLSSFTRLDMVGRPGSTWTAALALLPERRDQATLGTFDPPESTASITRHVVDVSVGGTNPIKGTLALETLAHVKLHDVTVRGQGTAPMELFPAGRRGAYFNDQQRDAWSAQWRSAVSGVRQHLAGTHFFKAGGDVLFASSREQSAYRPVLVRRADGSLARAIVFEPSDGSARSAWDVAMFAQDRWQPRSSVLVDAGVRLDRSGVVGQTTVSPRLGIRVGLGPRDRVTLGAGVGRFVEATPLVIGSTDALAARTVTDFDASGRQVGERRRLVPRFGTSNWQAPQALTWHAESEWRVVPTVTLRADVLVRRSTNEYVVAQSWSGETGWLDLDSLGRSLYREFAVGARYAKGTALTIDVGYVRSVARSDLNGAAAFLGTFRDPIVREPAYGPSAADAPNRVVGQVRGGTGPWRAAATFEFRDGFPYYAVDQMQEYVGLPRPAGRRTRVIALDAIAERRLRVGKLRPWVGLQVLNVLGRFNPRDVQNNVAAFDFGTMYDSERRRVRLTLRF